MQILVFMLTIIALFWRHETKSYYELIEELGCHNTEFRLSCGSLKANIAIFEATFSQNVSLLKPLQSFCGIPDHPTKRSSFKFYRLREWESLFHRKNSSSELIEVSFRHAINRRCSGVNYCSFVFSEDFDVTSRLGPGAVYLRYACVNDQYLTTVCNSIIDVSVEGFVETPGYPDYYIGESNCLWTLTAPPSQRVRVAFLDVSLRGIAPYEGTCLDWVIVTENGLNLLSKCGDIIEDTSIISHGQTLNVSFRSSSKTLFPKRGFLFHYKAVGCPLLGKPQDGYLINKNETFAHFRCCVGFVFPDTLSRDRILTCYNENTWDSAILDCVNVTEILRDGNNSQEVIAKLSADTREIMEKPDSVKDIIIPSIIMCVIIIGNGIVVYFIYRQRKKLGKTEKLELKENTKTRNLKHSTAKENT